MQAICADPALCQHAENGDQRREEILVCVEFENPGHRGKLPLPPSHGPLGRGRCSQGEGASPMEQLPHHLPGGLIESSARFCRRRRIHRSLAP